ELPMKNLIRLAMFFAVASLALGCRVETSLVRAVKAGDLETVKSILSRDSVNVDEAVGQEGMTALMYAANWSSPAIMEELIRYGADVNKRSMVSRTSMHYAAIIGKTDNLDVLIRHGAFIDGPSAKEYTPLMSAAES